MSFSQSFTAGWNIGSDIVASRLAKQEKERAKKLLEEYKAKVEEYQLSGNEISYSEKLVLGTMVSELGKTYADVFSQIDTAQSNYDKQKLIEDAQNLRNKNDNLTTLIKEMKDNPYLSGADLSALDEITGMPLSKVFTRESIDDIKANGAKTEAMDQKLGILKDLPTEYKAPYAKEQGLINPELQPTPTTSKSSELSAKDNWAIEQYKIGKISFDQLSKYMGTYIAPENPEKATALENDIKAMKEYGASNEEIKNHLIGKSNTPRAGEVGAEGITAEDVLFDSTGKKFGGEFLFSGLDINTLDDAGKEAVKNKWNRIKSIAKIPPEEITRVEGYLTQQLQIDLNPPAPTPEPIPEPIPEEQSGDLLQKAGTFIKGEWGKAKNFVSNLGKKKDYTTMTVEELYKLADEQNDSNAYTELKRRGLIK
jgi:hypothetical protein